MNREKTEKGIWDGIGEEEISEQDRPHVLVVDDDEKSLRIAGQILSEYYRASCVGSGEEALAFLRGEQPDLILLDSDMPGMDGFAVISRLKEDPSTQGIPVILLMEEMSAANAGEEKDSYSEILHRLDMIDTEVRGFQEGVHDFIHKPFIPDIMLQRMSRVLEFDRLKKDLQREVAKQTRVAEERLKKVERVSEQAILTLVKTIEAKDKYTNGHSERVAAYAREIARRAGMSQNAQASIYFIGLLHDIGKIGIPDTVINKASGLTDEEFALIRDHPRIGAEILKNISEIPGIDLGARYHHERYGGGGYPDGIAGEEIPLYARIIGVADAYDAMASRRSYRDVLPQEVVKSEIEKGKGTQFDPRYADIMLEMIADDQEYKMREQ